MSVPTAVLPSSLSIKRRRTASSSDRVDFDSCSEASSLKEPRLATARAPVKKVLQPQLQPQPAQGPAASPDIPWAVWPVAVPSWEDIKTRYKRCICRVQDGNANRWPDAGDAQSHINAMSDRHHDLAVEDYFRTLFSRDIDFACLGAQEEDFGRYVKNGTVDFADSDASRALSTAITRRFFGVDLILPENRLCPAIPCRQEYILFVRDLLDTTTYHPQPYKRLRRGIDIGTGCSAVYPQLAVVQRPWLFLATELDEQNFYVSKESVRRNGLDKYITHVRVHRPEQNLLPYWDESVKVDFVMTNPPFYASEDEIERKAAFKKDAPSSVCTGAPVEMVCTGGEVGFVKRLVEESSERKGSILWYTAMLGNLSSVGEVLRELKARKIDNFIVRSIAPGSRTKRWLLAWSYGTMKPENSVGIVQSSVGGVRTTTPQVQKQVSRMSCNRRDPSLCCKLDHVIENCLSGLSLLFYERCSPSLLSCNPRIKSIVATHGHDAGMSAYSVVVRAHDAVWERRWRRREITDAAVHRLTAMPEDGTCKFGVEIIVYSVQDDVCVDAHWREGVDVNVFLSFCKWLGRAIEQSLAKSHE